MDVSEVVEDVVERLRPQLADAKCELTLELARGITAHWDRTRIEQVVWNLVSNAIKYAAGCAVHVSTGREDGRARIEVRDEGPGIPEAVQTTIFERFERGNPKAGIAGLGLGLYILRRIAEGHGGRAWVESRPGWGSRFVVEMPLAPPALAGGTLDLSRAG